jgi:hypothetical protein
MRNRRLCLVALPPRHTCSGSRPRGGGSAGTKESSIRDPAGDERLLRPLGNRQCCSVRRLAVAVTSSEGQELTHERDVNRGHVNCDMHHAAILQLYGALAPLPNWRRYRTPLSRASGLGLLSPQPQAGATPEIRRQQKCGARPQLRARAPLLSHCSIIVRDGHGYIKARETFRRLLRYQSFPQGISR